jgi:hypothetical protein
MRGLFTHTHGLCSKVEVCTYTPSVYQWPVQVFMLYSYLVVVGVLLVLVLVLAVSYSSI